MLEFDRAVPGIFLPKRCLTFARMLKNKKKSVIFIWGKMIVHGVVAVHREDSAKRVSVNGVNSNAVAVSELQIADFSGNVL